MIGGERGSEEFERFCEILWNFSLNSNDSPSPWWSLSTQHKKQFRTWARMAFAEVAKPMLVGRLPERMTVDGRPAVGGGALILFADLEIG